LRPVPRRSRPARVVADQPLEVVIFDGSCALVVGLMLRLALDLFWPTRSWSCRIIGLLRPGSGHRFTDRCDPPSCCYCGTAKPQSGRVP